jgi:glycosyltransferase involved in cell wall biosynthesis
MPVPDLHQMKLGDVADAAGLHRVHILAWRDLEDVEAGGSEVHAAEIATRWAAAGIDVLLRTSHAQNRPDVVERDGYRVVRQHGRHMVFLDAPLRELTGRHGRRDGLLEVWNGLPFFAPLWAKGPRATFVHHVHADMWRKVLSPGLARLGEALELRIAPPLYRRSTILTPSESSRAQIVRRLRLPAHQVTAIPNGIHGRFSPAGARSPQPLVLCVGRLVPHKRVDLVIHAAAEARASVADLQLVIVGDGYERPALERQVQSLGAEPWVRLAGRASDEELVDLYRQAWTVISASTDEGWGMTITEAAACGTPAVATRIAGHVDVIADGESGLLADTPAELTAALTSMLTDADQRARLGAGALARTAALTWDRTALEVLRGIAGPGRR